MEVTERFVEMVRRPEDEIVLDEADTLTAEAFNYWARLN